VTVIIGEGGVWEKMGSCTLLRVYSDLATQYGDVPILYPPVIESQLFMIYFKFFFPNFHRLNCKTKLRLSSAQGVPPAIMEALSASYAFVKLSKIYQCLQGSSQPLHKQKLYSCSIFERLKLFGVKFSKIG